MPLSSEVLKKCQTCQKDLPETYFRKYKVASSEVPRRLKNCDGCRQQNPVLKKSLKPKNKDETTTEQI
jgi:hypothetical protein